MPVQGCHPRIADDPRFIKAAARQIPELQKLHEEFEAAQAAVVDGSLQQKLEL